MRRTKSQRLSLIAEAWWGMVFCTMVVGTAWASIDAWLVGNPWVAVIVGGFWTAVAIAVIYYKGGSDE